MTNGRTRINIQVDEQLHRRAKAEAALRGKSLTGFVVEAILDKMHKEEVLGNFLDEAVPFVKSFLNNDPGTILVWEPGGFFHGSALQTRLNGNERDIPLVLLEQKAPDSMLLCGRKVVVVSDSVHSGRSFQEIKRLLLTDIGAKDVRIVTYEDFSESEKADFAVKRQSGDEHLKHLLSLLSQSSGNI